MAYETLKDAIKQAIKQNGNQEITGDVLQTTLLNMVNELNSKGLKFAGVVNPTFSGNLNAESFYACVEIGYYKAFGNIYKSAACLSFIINDNGRWVFKDIVEYNRPFSISGDIDTESFHWIKDSKYQIESDIVPVNSVFPYIDVYFVAGVLKFGIDLYDKDKQILGSYDFDKNNTHVDIKSIYTEVKYASVKIKTIFDFSGTSSPFTPFVITYVSICCNMPGIGYIANNCQAMEKFANATTSNASYAKIKSGETKSLYVFHKSTKGTGNILDISLSNFSKTTPVKIKFFDTNALEIIKEFTLPYTDSEHIYVVYDRLLDGIQTYARRLLKTSISHIEVTITNTFDTDIEANIHINADNYKNSSLKHMVLEREKLQKSSDYKELKLDKIANSLFSSTYIRAGHTYRILTDANDTGLVSISVKDIDNISNTIHLKQIMPDRYDNTIKDAASCFDFIADKDYVAIGLAGHTMSIFEKVGADIKSDYNFGILHSSIFVSALNRRADRLYSFALNDVDQFKEYVVVIDVSNSAPFGFSISSVNSRAELVDRDLIYTKNYAQFSTIGKNKRLIATFRTTKSAVGFKAYINCDDNVNAFVHIYERTDESKTQLCINPLSYKDCSDPTVWKDKNTNILYALGSPWAFTNYTLLSSPDGKTWNNIESYYPFDDDTIKQLSEYTSGIWAPCVISLNEKYMLYSGLVSPSKSAIAIFESNSAFGKFKFLKTILSSTDTGIQDTIDPCIIRGEDSNLYLFYGSLGGIYRVKLSQDGLSAESSPTLVVKCTTADGTRNKSYEGTYLYWHDGYWYMFISAGNFNSDYRLCVGRSKTITGDFLDRDGNKLLDGYATTILEGNKTQMFYSPGHNGEIFVEGGKYYIYLHAISNINYGEFDSALGKISNRQLFKQELVWSSLDGFPEFKNNLIQPYFKY